jgi:hypothetical protein
MRLTHLLAPVVVIASSYGLYQKLNSVSPEEEQVLSELTTASRSLQQLTGTASPEPTPIQSSSVSEKPQNTKPEAWVCGLPVQAQAKYLEIRNSLRGNDRIQAIRSWMVLWNKHLRDPELSYVEFDYIDFNIKNRSPVLYVETNTKGQSNTIMAMVKTPDYRYAGPWKKEFQQRLSTLDSMENMLRFIRLRSASHPGLQTMIGELTDRITSERTQLAEYRRYFDDNRLR